MKNLLFIILIILSCISCIKDTTRNAVNGENLEITTPAGTKTIDYYYIYSMNDVEKLKNINDLGTIKTLYVNSSSEIIINIPKLREIETLYVYNTGKITIKNVTTINKLSNGYSDECVDISLPDLFTIDEIKLEMSKTPNFNFPKVTKAKKIYIYGTNNDVTKDLNLDNIEEVTEILEVYGRNINVSLENFKTGNLKFSYIKSLNGLNKTTNMTGLELYNTDIEEFNNSFIKSIAGNLKIDSNLKLKLLNLSNLESITGSLYISSNNELLSSSFENLKSIGKNSEDEDKGLYFYYNNKMTYLNLNKTESVQGKFEIQYNTALTEINFPALTTVNKRLYLYNIDKATKFNFPVLGSVANDLEMSYNDKLTSINFDNLNTVGNVLIYKSNYANNLELKFPLLETIGMGVDIGSNSYLKILEIDKMITTKYVTIKSNSSLDSISLKGLTNVDTIVDISRNKSSGTIYVNHNLVTGQSKTIEGTIIEN